MSESCHIICHIKSHIICLNKEHLVKSVDVTFANQITFITARDGNPAEKKQLT